jgi:hypothetical protein
MLDKRPPRGERNYEFDNAGPYKSDETATKRRWRLLVNTRNSKALSIAQLETPTDLESNAMRGLASALNMLLADIFRRYLKTKNVIGPSRGRTSATTI